ncbi:MAG: hypothetical protein ABL986_19250 [Vicinamibacterales bacterium]
MNKDQLRKNQHKTAKLHPEARGMKGEVLEDDWTFVVHDNDTVTLTNTRTQQTLRLGCDNLEGWDSDAARGDTFGFLKHHMSIGTDASGQLFAKPTSLRPIQEAPPRFNPLLVRADDVEWQLIWDARDAQLHRIPETNPRQLYEHFTAVCAALREITGREPQFDSPNDIRHELVYGLTDDHRARFQLLGGMNGAEGTGVLVLRRKSAAGVRLQDADAENQERADKAELMQRLSACHAAGVDNVLNRYVNTSADQDALDADRQQWKAGALQAMRDAGCTASDIARVDKLGTYQGQHLRPLFGPGALILSASEQLHLAARNKKHRDNMAERLNRLMTALQNLERV